jgi:SAM-dependent methyltransferase
MQKKMINKNQKIEKLLSFIKFSLIYCNCCGGIKRIKIKSSNFREDCVCKKCRSSSRKRHIAFVFLKILEEKLKQKLNALVNIPAKSNLAIYNLESYGGLHKCLKHTQGYLGSEYFGTEQEFGKMHNGILNVDLMQTPFENDAFNYIISTEVFEHIPDPYKAFKETYRILKKGGAHVFTIPYDPSLDTDQIRAILNEQNEIVHLLEPEYHGDTLREEGVLVFTIFSKAMITKLEELGFSVKVDHRIDYKHGIIGDNNIVFTAIKL